MWTIEFKMAPRPPHPLTNQEHVLLLAKPESGSLFGRVTAEFIRCAKESTARDPRVLMRNMRQFMNGLKNYLVR